MRKRNWPKKYEITVWDENKLKSLLNKAIEQKKKFLKGLLSEIGADLTSKKQTYKEPHSIKENLKELVEQNKGKPISDDSSQTYPIFLKINKENQNYLIINYTRRNGFEIMYNEDICANLKEDKIAIFEDILGRYGFVERKRRDIKEMQYHIDSMYIAIALGKELDFATEIIADILTKSGISNLDKLEFKFIDNTKNDGCSGCCAGGLIPTLILFLPFITIFPSKKMLISIINFHQKVTSPKLNKLNVKCRYEPSCSEYGKLAILKYGAIKGGWMSIIRLSHCTPNSNHNAIDYP